MQILKDEVRIKIIEAATEDFLDVGFRLASTRRIIEKAKVSKGNLYNYFHSKEELFYEIVSPVYNYLSSIMRETFSHGESEGFDPSEMDLLAGKLGELMIEYRKQFIILLSKSEGTRYEDYKERLIERLTEHYLNNYKSESDKIKLKVLMRIAAMNIINALLEIARNYRDREWTMVNIGLMMNYHLNGIKQYY